MSDPAEVSKLSLLATALLLSAFCIVAIVTASSHGGKRPDTALAPSATATLPLTAATQTPSPTPPASSGPLLPHPPPPTPTREPGRGLQETTLIDLQTGQTTPLWQDDERVGRIAFSLDGRWLVFYRSRLGADSSFQLYRVDVRPTSHQIEPLAKGFLYSNDAFSFGGDLAFAQPQPDGSFRAAVMLPDGTAHQLDSPGHFTTWSPDGRWLSYEEDYHPDDSPMAQFLVDTETWQEQRIGASKPCHCDGNPRPIWAPDSAHYIYPYITGEIGVDSRGVYELREPLSGIAPRLIDRADGWLDSQHYVARVPSGNGDNSFGFFSVDVDTGESIPLFMSTGHPSPNWTRMAVGYSGGLQVVDRDGNATPVGGEFRGWSPDGRYLLTYDANSDCGSAFVVYGPNNQRIGCAPVSADSSTWAFGFSDDSFAYISASGEAVINPNIGGDVYVMDLTTGTARQVAHDLRGVTNCVAFSPDGRYLVAGYGCGV